MKEPRSEKKSKSWRRIWRRCEGSRLELFWVQVEKPSLRGGRGAQLKHKWLRRRLNAGEEQPKSASEAQQLSLSQSLKVRLQQKAGCLLKGCRAEH